MSSGYEVVSIHKSHIKLLAKTAQWWTHGNTIDLVVVFTVKKWRFLVANSNSYYSFLIKFKNEKKWAKIKEEFNLEVNCISEAFSSAISFLWTCLRSLKYNVLNSIVFTNEIHFKIGYIPSLNCPFRQDTKETRNHVSITCPFSYSTFWMDLIANIVTDVSSVSSDVVIGILKERMDLGKSYLWSCRHKDIKPSISYFKKIIENKYEPEK